MRMVPRVTFESVETYYDRPVVKKPPWNWAIPAYFFTGGLAAGSALVGAGSRALGDDRTARRSYLVATAAMGASVVFLVEDLGVKRRFPNMLRVFKPTSPMNMGSWILAAFTPAVGGAATLDLLGVAPPLRVLAEIGAAVTAPAVATYTAVLVADTAVPAWHEAYRELPFVFMGSALASAGAAAMLHSPGATSSAPRRLALAGGAIEITATTVMEQRLGELAHPYHEGKAGRLAKTARAMVAAGLLGIALPARRRGLRLGAAALLLAGSAVERFAIFHAGVQSAENPRATIAPQRDRVDRGESTTGAVAD
jgi:hypothetical protein